MPQPSCMCTILLKLAKVELLKIRKFWVHVLIITAVIISTLYMDPKFSNCLPFSKGEQ